MNFPNYFIKHPVIAFVLNALIIIIGLMCLNLTKLREYPDVEMPVLTVETRFLNASPYLIEANITNVLEDQLAGVEGVETMTSLSKQNVSNIEMVFQEGTNIDRALSAVRDAVGMAKSMLPRDAFDPVVKRKSKEDGAPFMAISITNPDMGFAELTHYTSLFIQNNFRSIKGVAEAKIWGQSYTMSVKLDIIKMVAFGVNVDEVYAAIERSNISWPVGKFQDQISTTLDLKLNNPNDFKDLFIKMNKDKQIYLADVADIDLTTDDNNFRCRINGVPGLILAIIPANDANPIDVSTAVRAQVDILKKTMPTEISISIDMDQSDFIRASLKNIKQSIFEAIALVLVIVFLFLRNLRATLIPLVTVPVSLIGSVIFLKVFGFSINTITLLAMVLAIGLVVDDAIVVLENITQHIEKGLSPLEASLKGSREIGFAIVAMTLTLASVYAPIAFIQGAIGQLFIEFAVALAGSVLISGLVALILSPMMCAYILKDQHYEEKRFWPQIDIYLNLLEQKYQQLLGVVFKHTKYTLLAAGAVLISTVVMFSFLPQETAPKEDRGLMGVFVPPIPGTDIATMEEISLKIEEQLKNIPETQTYLNFVGSWGASICLCFKPHGERKRSPVDVVRQIFPQMMAFPSVDAWSWSLDSRLPGLDNAFGGNELSLIVTTANAYADLYAQANKVREKLEDAKLFATVSHDLKLDTPGYEINVDNNAMAKLGIFPGQISKTIEVFFSGQTTLYFEKDGLRYPITLKGNAMPWSLNELYVTTPKGRRVSLGTLATLDQTSQPAELMHHNQMRAVTLKAELLPEAKINTMMPKMWKVAAENVPMGYKKEWSGIAKAYEKSSTEMFMLFFMALVFIYAILTIQFENFMDPLIILMTVPLANFGGIFFLWIFGQSINIYTQIGLITLIGLITKHGILIVEFANQRCLAGDSFQDAVKKAALCRLRPILMTTAAMVFGTIPLMLSMGAGSEARRCIGFVLVGGLIFGTCFTLLLLPKIYCLIKTWPQNDGGKWLPFIGRWCFEKCQRIYNKFNIKLVVNRGE